MKLKKRKKIVKYYKKGNLQKLSLVSGVAILGLSIGLMQHESVRADQVAQTVSTSNSVTNSSSSTTQQSTASSSQNTSANSSSTDPSSSSSSASSSNTETTSKATTVLTSSESTNADTSSSTNEETATSSSSSSDSFSSVASSNDDATSSSSVDSSSSTDTASSTESNTQAKTTTTTTANTTTTSTSAISNIALASSNSVDTFTIGDSRYTSVDAVDVSSYQSWMTQNDYNELKALGVTTVIVKISEGSNYTNPYAAQQIRYAQNAGLKVAVYHYIHFSNQSGAVSEANHTVSVLRNLGLSTSTLVFADVEDQSTLSNSSATNATDSLNAFWNTLSGAGYNNHAVYVYQSYAYRDAVINTVGVARTWLAQYPYTPSRGGSYETDHQASGYGGWQFSSQATLPGSSNYLDASHDYNGLLKNLGISSNEGYFDNISMNGTTLNVSGWHAADASENKPYTTIIVYDTTTNTELTRVSYNANERDDVYSAYPNIYNSKYSGFNTSIDLSKYNIANHSIKVIARFSDQANGNGNYTDLWSDGKTLVQNRASFDSVTLNGTKLNVSGWHATDESVFEKNAYIILYDATLNKEIARVKYTPSQRNDVYNAYNSIYGSSKSGFNVSFDLSNVNFAGHNLQVVARYSNDSAGNGNYTDVWSDNYNFNNNNSWIDSVKFNGSSLNVSGWHVADASSTEKYAYIVLYDATTNKEIERVKYNPSSRSDVGSVYSNTYNSANSGFNVSFDLSNVNFAGHNLRIVTRYSNDPAGNGNFTDVWSGNYNFNNNNSWIDSVKFNGSSLNVAGWHVTDNSSTEKYAYIVLYDATTNKEIERVKYNPSSRSDVGSVYSNTYNSANSGFNVSFDLSNVNFAGHNLRIVTRYSNDPVGNGNFTDVWSDNYNFNQNTGYIDSVSASTANTIAVSGWHIADASATKKYTWLIVLDKTTGKELTRVKYTPTTRSDVNKVYNETYNSNISGFNNIAITLPTSLTNINGHSLQIVARYSDDATFGNGSFVDYYSKLFTVKNGKIV